MTATLPPPLPPSPRGHPGQRLLGGRPLLRGSRGRAEGRRRGQAARGGEAKRGGLRAGTPQPPHKPPFVLLRVPLLPLARGPRSLPRYPLSLPSPEWMYGCTCLFIDTLSPPPPPTRTCPPPRRASERASEGPLHVIAAATFLHSPNSGPAPGTSAAPPPHRDRARRRGEAHNFS